MDTIRSELNMNTSTKQPLGQYMVTMRLWWCHLGLPMHHPLLCA
jgi:hypothetical protein